jgi:hypothetical protein
VHMFFSPIFYPNIPLDNGLFVCLLFCVISETESSYVAQASLELVILLSQPGIAMPSSNSVL